jgi:hypothetical protein
MAALMINPIQDSTSDEDIRAFLIKYGFPSYDRIERVSGDGTRPAVLLTFENHSAAALRTLVPAINHIFWKEHSINAMVMREPSS